MAGGVAATVSRMLGAAGHTRYRKDTAGYSVHELGSGRAAVYHMSARGFIQPPGRPLQAYGQTLALRGCRVEVVDHQYLSVAWSR